MCSALAFLSIAPPAHASANLIRDPGFLSPPTSPGHFSTAYAGGSNIGPWIVVGPGNVVTESTTYQSRGFLFNAKTGSAFLDLTGLCDCGAASGVAQTVATVPGAAYQLSFWVGNTVIPGAGSTSTVNVFANGTLLLSAVNSQGAGVSDQVWQHFTTTFVASSSETQLSFYNGDPDGDINNGLDDVQLVLLSNSTGFTTLYTFTGTTDGSTPNGGMAASPDGLLYGSTYGGGPANAGTVFSFNPTAKTLVSLYAFTGHADGDEPVTKLTLGSDGSIYGATQYGGTANAGAIFKLTAPGFQPTTLYSFQAHADGADPGGGLLIDSSGNLYGDAFGGGAYNFGNVFKINPAALTESTLYSFPGGANGSLPALLAFSPTNLILGTTREGGGAGNAGTIYQLNQATGRKRTLYQFTGGANGSAPNGPLLVSSAGIAFGTTHGGGSAKAGTLYMFNTATLKLTTLYTFTGGADGSGPLGGLAADTNGNIYGVTSAVNGAAKTGTLFEYSASTGQLTTLHAFTGGADGAIPNDCLIFDASGVIYGTTRIGGSAGFGTIFSYAP
jgi:uncharacterized repeat protein (TIGR03803 family)